jgi:hypothetical protein
VNTVVVWTNTVNNVWSGDLSVFVPLLLAEAVLACPGCDEYAAYLPELVSACFVKQHLS